MVGFLWVPTGDDEASAGRVALDFFDDAADLIDAVVRVGTIGQFRRAEAAPLVSVDRTEVSFGAAKLGALFGGGPFVPDGNAPRGEPRVLRAAGKEPQQLVRDGLHVDLLGRQQREAFGQVEAKLGAEDADRPRAGTVAPDFSVLPDMAKQVEIRLHGVRLFSVKVPPQHGKPNLSPLPPRLLGGTPLG